MQCCYWVVFSCTSIHHHDLLYYIFGIQELHFDHLDYHLYPGHVGNVYLCLGRTANVGSIQAH